MFCPVCKTEYREGFSKCSDCGADLVAELPKPNESVPGQIAEPIWEGNDSHALAAVKRLLEDAQIPYSVNDSGSHMLFTASMVSPVQVYVLSKDFQRSRSLVDEWLTESGEDSDSAQTDDSAEEQADEEPESEDGSVSDSSSDAQDYVPEDWNPEAASCEIWKGNDSDLLETLRMSLTENGVGSQIISEGELTRLMIYPADEARAREITREIIEGTPPA
jgi:hypothetical protein